MSKNLRTAGWHVGWHFASIADPDAAVRDVAFTERQMIMTSIPPEQQALEWQQLLEQFPAEVAAQVKELADIHRVTLATYFYDQMLEDQEANRFLSHDQVRTRLHGSLQQWIGQLFSASADRERLLTLVTQQKQIGEIHARINIPVHVVLRGARHLKHEFLALLLRQEIASQQKLQCTRLIVATIDQSMEIMSRAYSDAHDRNSRSEEGYRLFSVAQNIGSEKERQCSAILNWENEVMFAFAMGLSSVQLPRMVSSEFGLWFRHKGAYAFEGTTETEQILQGMEHIDEELLPLFNQPDRSAEQRLQDLRNLREQTKSIIYHLNNLFEQINVLESGRDALTRMLNRKFLPVILSKEVAYALHTHRSFAVLAIDIDHFKSINDSHGHEAGDLALQQVATLLSNNCRGGDYVFRMGGEEFLILLVDINENGALGVAEKLRQQIEQERFQMPGDRMLKVTVSVGLALHDGHPDYQRLLRRADEALYEAKHGGRNRVVVARG